MQRPGTGSLLIILLFTACGAQAEMYKWIDESGYIHYSDKPPEAEQESLEITGRISSYDSPEILPAAGSDADKDKKPTSARNKRVMMYSAEWCGVCKRAKQYFAANNISYTEYDIDKNAKAKADFDKMNARGVPVILVDDRRMNGFSSAGFEQLYYGQQ